MDTQYWGLGATVLIAAPSTHRPSNPTQSCRSRSAGPMSFTPAAWANTRSRNSEHRQIRHDGQERGPSQSWPSPWSHIKKNKTHSQNMKITSIKTEEKKTNIYSGTDQPSSQTLPV